MFTPEQQELIATTRRRSERETAERAAKIREIDQKAQRGRDETLAFAAQVAGRARGRIATVSIVVRYREVPQPRLGLRHGFKAQPPSYASDTLVSGWSVYERKDEVSHGTDGSWTEVVGCMLLSESGKLYITGRYARTSGDPYEVPRDPSEDKGSASVFFGSGASFDHHARNALAVFVVENGLDR